MESKETPQLLSRLNEIVERSRRIRDKKIEPSLDQRARESLSTHQERVGASHKRKVAAGR